MLALLHRSNAEEISSEFFFFSWEPRIKFDIFEKISSEVIDKKGNELDSKRNYYSLMIA